jgi:hypothetical protein
VERGRMNMNIYSKKTLPEMAFFIKYRGQDMINAMIALLDSILHVFVL